jgi:PAS domain S-box-containing protein
VATSAFDAERFALLERIARGEPLDEILDAVVRLIEDADRGMIASVVQLDPTRTRIGSVIGRHLAPDYREALRGLAIGPRHGSCGTAAYLGTRVIVEDIETHPYWDDYKHLALPHGLRACWSTPITSPAGEVLGTFALYYTATRSPSDEEIARVEAATHLASLAIVRDRNEESLRRSEARAHELARLYAVSSGINEAITRLRDPQALYERACQLAVREEFARLAWVGVRDARQGLRPVARAGVDDGYLDEIVLNLDDPRMNRGPAGEAIREGRYAVRNDIAADATFFWKQEALARQLRSCVAFPLFLHGEPYGVFVLYSDRVNYFNAEELRVLTQLAADISFSVESTAGEQERQRLARVEEVARSEERLRALAFSLITDVIFYLAVDEDSYTFVSVNPAFLRTTGLTESQVIGKRVEDVIPAAVLPTVFRKYQDAIRTGRPATWEEISEYPSGVKHGEVTVVPVFDEEGRCTHLIGSVHDLTERANAEEQRRRLELQLHQAQRLQSLGTLAGGIAHDFNNVLTAINGFAELAISEQGRPEVILESLQEIRRAGRRASDLVRQILMFSRKEEPIRRPLALRPVVDEAIKMLRATTPAAIQIHTRMAAGTPPVLADATQLHQVLTNIGVNAVQAIGSNGGTIDVVAEPAVVDENAPPELAELPSGRYARLTVRDTGGGMDSSTLARAFEPFFTTKPAHQGTGLGLSVVHGIMSAHLGAVTVESELGKGTAFHLYFPAAETAPAPTPAPEQPAAHAGGRILYVDDDEALVFLARRSLTKLGYRVTAFTDPLQALQAFRSGVDEFDILVTDTSMPGLSGPDLIKEVRTLRADLPVVLLSGYMRPDDAEKARQMGISNVLLKPHTASELAEILHRTIREQSGPLE